MTLYRARPGDGVAWITGASTGIGRRLALDLAAAGYTVAATARSHQELEAVAAEATGLPGRILPFACDVADEAGMAAAVAAIESEAGEIVLAVFNAGIFLSTRGDRLEVTNLVRTFEINVFGVVYGLVPAVDRMRARGRGHVVFVGSVNSYFGLPSAAGYGASKAALNNMAEALRFDFEKMNIRTQVVNPGFVATPLTDRNRFPMPALLSVETASRRIVAALSSGGFESSFPRRLTWPAKLLRLLPGPFVFAFLNRVTGWRNKPLGPRDKSSRNGR